MRDATHCEGCSEFTVAGMWRYRAVLPEVMPVTLGEGWTPMLRSKRYQNVFLKEEGANPTGSFKARDWHCRDDAKHFGLRKLAVPSAGNAAGALAAYARLRTSKPIFYAKDVPFANYVEAVLYGANVTLVDGLISDCGRWCERKERRLVRYFDVEGAFPYEGRRRWDMNSSSSLVGVSGGVFLSDGARVGLMECGSVHRT